MHHGESSTLTAFHLRWPLPGQNSKGWKYIIVIIIIIIIIISSCPDPDHPIILLLFCSYFLFNWITETSGEGSVCLPNIHPAVQLAQNHFSKCLQFFVVFLLLLFTKTEKEPLKSESSYLISHCRESTQVLRRIMSHWREATVTFYLFFSPFHHLLTLKMLFSCLHDQLAELCKFLDVRNIKCNWQISKTSLKKRCFKWWTSVIIIGSLWRQTYGNGFRIGFNRLGMEMSYIYCWIFTRAALLCIKLILHCLPLCPVDMISFRFCWTLQMLLL